jgi:6,7-dimethyl-8-ribityllumazine synthase
MPRVLTGDVFGQGSRFGIVVARFNELVTRSLLDGAIDGLSRHGVDDDDIDVAWVPGSFEIPLVARKLAETGDYAAVICLGAVIRGETDHYDHVAGAVTSGVARVGMDTGVPTIFGILTTDTVEQALNRAGLKSGNNGYAAAVAAIETSSLIGKVARRQEIAVRG